MPTLQAHGLLTGTAPITTTVTAGGTNRLAVFWMAFPFNATGTINGFTYNGTALPFHAEQLNSGSVQLTYLVLGWTTTVADSATLIADALPLYSGVGAGNYLVGWATFSDAHQGSPLHWGHLGTGPFTTYGVGKNTGATLNSYVSSADLVYGLCWVLDNSSTNIADAGVTDLDGTVFSPGTNHQAVHGTVIGTNDDNWNLTWHRGSGAGPAFVAGAVVIRDIANPPATAANQVLAWGRQTDGFGTVRRVHPWGDGFSRWADPTLISVSFSAASANAEVGSAVGIGLGKDGFPYTWGDDVYGLRGDGTTGAPLASPFKLSGYADTTDVCAGLGNVFWISSNVLYGLGHNSNGEFANGTTTDSATPVTMTLPGGATPIKVRGGDSFVLVLDNSGKVWRAGNIGAASTTFTQIGAYSAYTEIDAGIGHGLLLRGDGSADDWQGGATIVNVSVGSAISDICAYGDAIALMTSNDIWTRGGSNVSGELGRNTTPLNPISTLAGSTPKALAKRGLGSRNLLWIGTNGHLYGCGETAAGRQIDPFIGTTFLGASFDDLPEAVLSDRLTVTIDWVTGTSQLNRGLGVMVGTTPRGHTFVFLCGV